MFGLDMNAIAGQLKAFQEQSERLVNAVEKMEKDIALVKAHLGIQEGGPLVAIIHQQEGE
jgi:hypothetical protein